MMPADKTLLLACIITAGLTLAGCDAPSEAVVPAAKPVAPPVNERAGSRGKVDNMPPQEMPATTVKAKEQPKPLDLSMPPQPGVEFGALETPTPAEQPLLPDLFEQGTQAADRSIHLKGRVLMDHTGEHNLDAVEGGQVIIEMKTP